MPRLLLDQHAPDGARRARGVSSVEYIIVLVLVVLTGVAVFKLFGTTLKATFDSSSLKRRSRSCRLVT